ncbi:hypothetical protein FA15DRAFT_663989 [Coprinopsis marcescibilis]|uniref:Velvet domain-containing protein n=1 Tax=Coprinopsis marcescibilis TaxID=230819 RepID=A0A5C3L9F6_COPMA|nr:hypothetical protein FA15DRAFT_663989 [Coprinopsis marcescibilis]
MRAELVEIQKADLGRKYARVDRRPLDPPPVVLFRLYQVLDPGTAQEIEREIQAYDEVEMLGLVCTVDLFPVPGAEEVNAGGSVGSGRSSPSPRPGPSGTSSRRDSVGGGGSPTASSSYRYNSNSSSTSPSLPPSSYHVPSPTASPNDVVHYVNNFPVTEGSKVTNSLVGATFIQPNLVEYQGKKVLVFVFADLAVKNEGNFLLRYRAFDIYSRSQSLADDKVIMQAECYGGPFRVFSTKEFPGLQASTDLTKHLARWGVRLNIRETERRRRKKGDTRDSPPYTTSVLKRKRKEGRVEDDEDFVSEEE